MARKNGGEVITSVLDTGDFRGPVVVVERMSDKRVDVVYVDQKFVKGHTPEQLVGMVITRRNMRIPGTQLRGLRIVGIK